MNTQKITYETLVTDIGSARDDDLGSAQVNYLPADAPVSLVQEILYYALMKDKGYYTKEALLADGWEFSPEGPGWYDGEGDPEAAAWVWDWQQVLPSKPVYLTGRELR